MHFLRRQVSPLIQDCISLLHWGKWCTTARAYIHLLLQNLLPTLLTTQPLTAWSQIKMQMETSLTVALSCTAKNRWGAGTILIQLQPLTTHWLALNKDINQIACLLPLTQLLSHIVVLSNTCQQTHCTEQYTASHLSLSCDTTHRRSVWLCSLVTIINKITRRSQLGLNLLLSTSCNN